MENLCVGGGLVLSQNKRPYNLATFEYDHKEFGTQSETSLLINCEKLLVCHPKNGGVLGREVALEYLPLVNKHNTHNSLLLIK